MKRTILAAVAIAVMASTASMALADGFGPRVTKKQAAAAKAAARPASYGQTGDITLGSSGLKLLVPATYYYLPGPEARAYLQRIGAPAPAGEVLGMVAPANLRSIDPGFWGAVISTNPLGHVAEERADRLTAADFVDEVRGARPATARLEGFAAAPGYDRTRHAASWTERTAGAAGARTLRTEQRLLGRNSVVGVTIDSRADQQASVAAAGGEISRMISFPAGQTYGDYAPASDQAPIYDLPSLLTLKPKPTTTTVAAEPPPPEPTPAPPVTPAATTPATPEKGIPAQSNGLQRIDTASTGATPPANAPNITAAQVQQWLPWIGGGLILLAIVPWLAGLARSGGGGGARLSDGGSILRRRRRAPNPQVDGGGDPNITPVEPPPPQ